MKYDRRAKRVTLTNKVLFIQDILDYPILCDIYSMVIVQKPLNKVV